MACTWYDSSSDAPCGAESKITSNLNLCPDHREVIRSKWESKGKTEILRTLNYHPLEAFPGVCYIALMPDGLVKIGYSSTDKLYEKRIKALSRQSGAPVIELATVRGGFVAEAFLHDKFQEFRVEGPGERFTYSPEIAQYLASVKT